MGRSRAVTLAWEGKERLDGTSARSAAWSTPGVTQLPLAKASSLRTWSGDRGELVHGDNLVALRTLAKARAGEVTLAYLDPPFFTGRMFRHVERGTRVRRDAFDDRWTDRAAYLEALAHRLQQVRALLADHGSVVVHVDTKTSHYVKVLGDEIFGEEQFVSEIVWRYRRWPSKTPNFQRVHDVLLRWRKDARAEPRWTQLYEPLAASTIATWGTNKQRAVFREERGPSGEARRARSTTTSEPTRGAPMGDVWEIGVIAPVARERTGYPSQKPEALLERLVTALSNTGDLVLDPYAGSGTTLAVAARLGRRFVGIDASELAVETIRTRLSEAGVVLHEASATQSTRVLARSR